MLVHPLVVRQTPHRHLALAVMLAIFQGCSVSGATPQSSIIDDSVATSSPMERVASAERLALSGQMAQALDEYVWCIDNGLAADPPFAGVWSVLPFDIAELAKKYPPALKVLRDRRDAAEQVLTQQPLADTENPDASDRAALYSNINEALGEDERTLGLYRTLRKRGPELYWVRQALWSAVSRHLYNARSYGELLGSADMLEAELISRARQMSESQGCPDELRDHCAEMYLEQGRIYFETLLGTGHEAKSSEIAARLLNDLPATGTFAALMKSALRAGVPSMARKLLHRARSVVPEGQRAEVEEVGKLIQADGTAP